MREKRVDSFVRTFRSTAVPFLIGLAVATLGAGVARQLPPPPWAALLEVRPQDPASLRPLAPEWRWGGRKVGYEHMFRRRRAD